MASIQSLHADTIDRLGLLSYQDDGSIRDQEGQTVTLGSVCSRLQTSLNELAGIDLLASGAPERLASYLEAFEATVKLDIPNKH